LGRKVRIQRGITQNVENPFVKSRKLKKNK
jgi:hypothetical protein